jgi:hypothetical protein
MKTILHKKLQGILILIVLFHVPGCKRESTEPIMEHSFHGNACGTIPSTNQHVLIVKNPLGSIFIAGEGSVNSCSWNLDKIVTIQSVADTAALFSSMNLSAQKSNDTLFIEVTSTAPSGVKPGCLVQLSVPYSMICKIEQGNGDIEVDDLDSLLIIENASNVNVLRHNGSCHISSEKGNVSMMSAFPDSGFCVIKVIEGDILLKIPTSSSAQIYAKSSNGIVSQSRLTLRNSQQQSNFLSGVLGSGRGKIQLETNQGTIQIQGI